MGTRIRTRIWEGQVELTSLKRFTAYAAPMGGIQMGSCGARGSSSRGIIGCVVLLCCAAGSRCTHVVWARLTCSKLDFPVCPSGGWGKGVRGRWAAVNLHYVGPLLP